MELVAATSYVPLKASWEKVVKAQQSSEHWIKEYGLKASKLNPQKIASQLGFKKKSGHVGIINRRVTSKYGDNLFTRYSGQGEDIYQITADLPKVDEIEHQLLSLIAKLKSRLTWLRSGSRETCGIVIDRRPVLILWARTPHAKKTVSIATKLIEEQFVHTDCFNIVHCFSGVEQWQHGMTAPSLETIESAVSWLKGHSLTVAQKGKYLSMSILEALQVAFGNSEADSVYILSYSDVSVEVHSELEARLQHSPVRVHFSCIDCADAAVLGQVQHLASVTQGRIHCYQSTPDQVPSLTQEDVVIVSTELDIAKNSLAEVQALKLELKQQRTRPSDKSVTVETTSEDFMTSAEWLAVHGVRSNKLTFDDLVGSLAFRHCDGTLKQNTFTHSNVGHIEVVPPYQLIHAKYCSKFVHLRWRDDSIVHINLTEKMSDSFQTRLDQVIEKCHRRIAWLKQGSREVFGTILEESVVIVLDTSSSMKLHLPLVRHKFQQLLKEQLVHKKQFTILHFSSEVNSWRSRLVPVSAHTLDSALQWVGSLQAEGSSNTLDALKLATSIPGVQGVYFLTDGRPDQSPNTILGAKQSWPAIPVHTISFNCGDSQANHFLAQLAEDTGGRYHYFADNVEDNQGPMPYKSADLQILLDEIALAQQQIIQVQQLACECMELRERPDPPSPNETSNTRTRRSSCESISSVSSDQKKSLLPSKKWLKKNSLQAKGLTLVDALGPAAVPHSPSKPIPKSGKRVYGKVLQEVLPISHVTSKGHLTLVHPTIPDFRTVQSQLESQINVYRARLNKLTKVALSEEVFETVCADLQCNELYYEDHKERIMKELKSTDSLYTDEDFHLIEEEISKGNYYIEYLSSLITAATEDSLPSLAHEHQNSSSKKEVKKAAKSPSTNRTTSYKHSELASKIKSTPASKSKSALASESKSTLASKSKSTLASESKSTLASESSSSLQSQGTLKEDSLCAGSMSSLANNWHSDQSKSTVSPCLGGQAVLAQDPSDGFFYPARVHGSLPRKGKVKALFQDQDSQLIRVNRIIPTGGARPRPVPKVGDCVLARVRSKYGRHLMSHDQSCDFFIPVLILRVPLQPQLSAAYYNTLAYNGEAVMCTRNHMFTISNKQHDAFTKDIMSRQAEMRRSSISVRRAATTGTQTKECQSLYEKQLMKQQIEGELDVERKRHEQMKDERDKLKVLLDYLEDEPSSSPSSTHSLDGQLSDLVEPVEELKYLEQGTQYNGTSDQATSPLPELVTVGINTVSIQEKGTLTDPMADEESVFSKPAMLPDAKEETDGVTEGVSGTGGRGASEGVSGTGGRGASEGVSGTGGRGASEGIALEERENKSEEMASEKEKIKPESMTKGESKDLSEEKTEKRDGEPGDSQSTLEQNSIPKLNQHSFSPIRSSTPVSDIQVGTQVLVCWPTDGWYHTGRVTSTDHVDTLTVMDHNGDVDTPKADVIILPHTNHSIKVGDFVLSPHPHYRPFILGPGRIIAHMLGDLYTVSLFDEETVNIPGSKLVVTTEDRYKKDVRNITMKQQQWMGQTFVVRDDADGFYYHMTACRYQDGWFALIKLRNGSLVQQSSNHVFGSAQRKRHIMPNDYVIAFDSYDMSSVGIPSWVLETKDGINYIRQCHDNKSVSIPSDLCIWISEDYYKNAVNFILKSPQLNNEATSDDLSSGT